jgi:hypothetical protein
LYRQPIHHHMVHVSAQGIMRPEFLTDELVTFWHQPQMEGTPNGFE